MKELLLKKSKLYLILDTEVADYSKLLVIARKAAQGGAGMIQLRDKKGTAKDILRFSKDLLKILKRKVPYIINDRVDLAWAAQADGVHLGQDDLSIDVARRWMGKKAIIGISCQTLDAARKAESGGADYIGFGSVFKTLTKPERFPMDLNILKAVVNRTKIPVFPIGGIHQRNLRYLIQLGIKRAAVCRAILQAADVSSVTKYMVDSLGG